MKTYSSPFLTDFELKDLLNPAIEAMKRSSFNEPKKASSMQALGLIISRVCGNDIESINKIFAFALEDSNAHEEAGKLRDTFTDQTLNF